jgi:uncharacterized protein (DUF58 family)
MIVPQLRLLFWFALVALPFSVLVAAYPEGQLWSIALMAGLLIAAAIDAATALGRLKGLTVELPSILRFSKQRATSILATVKHADQAPMTFRLGLSIPSDLRAAKDVAVVHLRAGVESSEVSWPCQPSRRGRFHLSRAFLEGTSRLGLWAVRASVPVQCEIRVYPDLARERKSLAALFLNRGAFGIHAQRMVGKGRDFEKLREYIPGDSFDEIHWKATAKRGHPVTKIFQIERTQEIYIIIDASRLSARKPAREVNGPGQGDLAAASDRPSDSAILERFITSALVLAQAAEKQGDLFGLLTFSDQVDTFLRAKNGQQHYAACRDALYTLEAANVTPDFDEIVSFIRTRLRRRALLMFLTSLDDPMLAESFNRNMALLAGQHLVLVNMMLPPGVSPLFSRQDVTHLDDLYRHLGGHLQWQRLQELQRTLQYRGVRFSLLHNERMSTELVSQYLGVKQRQLI